MATGATTTTGWTQPDIHHHGTILRCRVPVARCRPSHVDVSDQVPRGSIDVTPSELAHLVPRAARRGCWVHVHGRPRDRLASDGQQYSGYCVK